MRFSYTMYFKLCFKASKSRFQAVIHSSPEAGLPVQQSNNLSPPFVAMCTAERNSVNTLGGRNPLKTKVRLGVGQQRSRRYPEGEGGERVESRRPRGRPPICPPCRQRGGRAVDEHTFHQQWRALDRKSNHFLWEPTPPTPPTTREIDSVGGGMEKRQGVGSPGNSSV